MSGAKQEKIIDKSLFFTSESPEFQGEKVLFRYLSKFCFFCRLKIQTALNE